MFLENQFLNLQSLSMNLIQDLLVCLCKLCLKIPVVGLIEEGGLLKVLECDNQINGMSRFPPNH